MNELLENLYRQHRQGLYSFALSIVRSPDLAEDAVQNAFAKLFLNPSGKSSVLENGNAVAYVFQAVRNSAIDLQRSDVRKRRLSEALFATHQPLQESNCPSEALLTRERDELLRNAIDQLSDADHEAVVLKLFAGLTFEQAGIVSQTSPKTIATRYRRALEKLENHLKGQL